MIEPYYQNQSVTLYCGECLAVMSELDMRFDACITDLPYGTVACSWDSVIPFVDMWRELGRLVKETGAICLFGIQPFSSYLRCSNIEMWKYDWIWYKGAFANFLNVKFQPGKVHEIISVFSRGASSFSKSANMVYNPQFDIGTPYFQRAGRQREDSSTVRSEIQQAITDNCGVRYPVSVIQFSKDRVSYHPTQKPVLLMEYLIRTYTNEGQYILDFTAGSGTTGVACMQAHRKCVLVQKQCGYCDVIVNRLHDKQKQMLERLF